MLFSILFSILFSTVCASPSIVWQKGLTPGLIYGTAWKKERTESLVLQAYLQGFRAFDTAAHPKHYDESLVGIALKKILPKLSRDELWIQTKFTPDACVDQPPSVHPYDPNTTVEMRVRTSFKGSLKRLGLQYVDSYLLHAPYSDSEDTLAAWREMEKILEEGGTKEVEHEHL